MADVTLTYQGSTIAELSDSGSKTLHTAGKYCEADIDVSYVKPSGGGVDWDGLALGMWPAGDVVLSENIVTIDHDRFRGNTAITSITAPGVQSITSAAFRECNHLKSAYFPELLTLNSSFPAFYGAGNASDAVGGAWVFPKLQSVPTDTFRQVRASAIDFGPDCASFGTRALYQPTYGGYIPVLILRRTAGVVSLGNVNSIDKLNGYSQVFVPAELISDYETATNWSTAKTNKGFSFVPIEGSIYEHAYANGIPIPTT